jgi:hypothetical protein
LEAFSMTTEMIRKAGGNESDMPKGVLPSFFAHWAGTKRSSAPTWILRFLGGRKSQKNKGKPVWGQIGAALGGLNSTSQKNSGLYLLPG